MLGTQCSKGRCGFLLQGAYCPAQSLGFASFPIKLLSELQRDGLTDAYCVLGHQSFNCLLECELDSNVYFEAFPCSGRLGGHLAAGPPSDYFLTVVLGKRSVSRSQRILGGFFSNGNMRCQQFCWGVYAAKN